MIRYAISTAAIACAVCLATTLSAKTSIPNWLEEAKELETPQLIKAQFQPYALIWDEAIYTVQPNGKIDKTIRQAYRMLDDEGSRHAVARAYYDSNSSTKPKLKAWTIKEDGDVHAYKRSDIQDDALNSFYLVNERRVLSIYGDSRTFEGDVFGFEYTTEESTIFTQYNWWFEGTRPVSLSRIRIDLPKDWTLDTTPFHGAPDYTRSELPQGASSYTWEKRDMPAKRGEKGAPYSALKHSHIRINLSPPEDSRLRHTNLEFKTWKDLSDFTADTMNAKATSNSEIVAKTNELIAGKSDQWQKVQAIGQYVQKLRYAAISLNLGNGGGYTPRPATETFRVGYGDCKDKSTLMISMLRIAGIEAYSVIVNARENDRVLIDWPSPTYFNHCILVVELNESIDVPAYLEDPELGHLVFIDPTSEVTPIGELPDDEQGGLVIIGKNGLDRLLRLPMAKPEHNAESYKIEAEFLGNGAIIGRLTKTLIGAKADYERYAQKRYSDTQYKSAVTEVLSKNNPSSEINIGKLSDNAETNRTVEQIVGFGIRSYGKLNNTVSFDDSNASTASFIFKPALFSRIVENPYTKKQRRLPLALRAEQIKESSKMYLPIGYIVEDHEPEVSIETDFGSYKASAEIIDDYLLYDRTFTLFDNIVPTERYAELREFYQRVVETDNTPIIMKKAPLEVSTN